MSWLYETKTADSRKREPAAEGLYSSRIVDWRRSRDSGALAGPGRPRGRPAAAPRDAQIARLRKERPSWSRS